MFTETTYLQDLIDTKRQITIFLINGFQIRGTITGQDQETIQLFADGRNQMIYKHAISTVDPKGMR